MRNVELSKEITGNLIIPRGSALERVGAIEMKYLLKWSVGNPRLLQVFVQEMVEVLSQ